MCPDRRSLDVTVAHIVTQFDGAALLRALEAATARLEAGVDEVNALNVYRALVATADGAVIRTRDENPTNRAAGVVDAGARGLQLILEGVLSSFTGEQLPLTHIAPLATPAGATARSQAPSWEGAYDVQFLVNRPSRPVPQVRDEMLKFGADCVLVVGDEAVLKVHVHTLQPDEIIRIGLTAGRVADVVVEDLDAMTAQHERATGIVVAPPARGPVAAIGVVAVVPGDGFAAVARSLGATVLRGGATMNPSTEELLGAIREANARTVVVLPNDKNVVLAAQQAATHADVNVRG